jgi:hypothetical protein
MSQPSPTQRDALGPPLSRNAGEVTFPEVTPREAGEGPRGVMKEIP